MRVRFALPVASLLLLVGLFPPSSSGQPTSDGEDTLILTNARLVDPETQTVERGALRIEGERIESVLEEAPSDFDGRILNLDGKWVLPGLGDAHVHSYGNSGPKGKMQILQTKGTSKTMLYAGVTAFLDLFSPEEYIIFESSSSDEYIFELRNRQRSEGLQGADIYGAGPLLTAPDGHGTQYGEALTVTSPTDAQSAVDSLAARSPDVVKLVYNPHNGRYPSMDRATMEAIIDAAHRHGLKTVVHVDTNWKGPAAAIQAGADAITHTPSPPMPDSVVRAMRQQGTIWIPTLAVHTQPAYWFRHPERLDNELLQAVVDSSLLASYRDRSVTRSFIEKQVQHRGTRFRSVAKAAEAGIPILTGTDAGKPGLFQGFSLHRELVLLTQAGLSNWEALAAATTVPGRFLDASFGLQPGDRANLLVLNASPLEDIHHTQNIHRVIYRGDVVDRSQLLQTIDSVQSTISTPYATPRG